MVSMATHFVISKNVGVSKKNTHISAATRHKILNLVSIFSKTQHFYLLVRYAHYLIVSMKH